ncbi:MAG TPA: NAD(P)H-dependent oxidoreductase [Candidatus Saccharimonadales bacterium]|nr:NAD(P)H-dependent oxidoreductase [Candidatus Saccharimonadales bacterium]
MQIAVISGSSRPRSQSLKISQWVVEKLKTLGVQPFLLDLHELLLPTEVDLLNFKNEPKAQKAWEPFAAVLEQAMGLVVVSPEWNGMAPPALMNFFEYASVTSKSLAHKPAHMLTVSSTDGGAYPAAELRVYGPKNNHFFYTPECTIIRNCESVFNGLEPQPNNSADEYLQIRALHGLRIFLEYAAALKTMRETARVDLLKYPNGM